MFMICGTWYNAIPSYYENETLRSVLLDQITATETLWLDTRLIRGHHIRPNAVRPVTPQLYTIVLEEKQK